VTCVEALLDRCEKLGVKLTCRQGLLHVQPPLTGISQALRDDLALQKREILAHLPKYQTNAAARRNPLGRLPPGWNWRDAIVPDLGESIIVVRSLSVAEEFPELYQRHLPVIEHGGFLALLGLRLADQQISYGRLAGVAVTQDLRTRRPPPDPPTAPHWPGYCHGAPLPPHCPNCGHQLLTANE
jgi:hypothetical protein